MPSTKIVNQKFQFIRRYLFPGVQWNDAPPNNVSQGLVNVLDMEHWVPIPRFQATAISPAPGAGRNACVALENFVRRPHSTGGLTTALATRFVITDLAVRIASNAGNTNVFLATRQQVEMPDGNSFAYPAQANPTPMVGGLNIYSGWGAPFAKIVQGDVAVAAALGTLLSTTADLHVWTHLPDIEPGNGVILIGGVANLATNIVLAWSERRVEGEDNVS